MPRCKLRSASCRHQLAWPDEEIGTKASAPAVSSGSLSCRYWDANSAVIPAMAGLTGASIGRCVCWGIERNFVGWSPKWCLGLGALSWRIKPAAEKEKTMVKNRRSRQVQNSLLNGFERRISLILNFHVAALAERVSGFYIPVRKPFFGYLYSSTGKRMHSNILCSGILLDTD